MKINGKLIFRWAKDLFPMHRSITGSTDKTYHILKIIGRLKIVKFDLEQKYLIGRSTGLGNK